jgi:hypothetical protein
MIPSTVRALAMRCSEACRIRRSRSTVIGDRPTAVVKRAMNAERLSNAARAKPEE